MKEGHSRFQLLTNWALVGVLVFLCAPWVLPSNKLYHQSVILLLWLPALLALGCASFRRLLSQLELILFVLLGVWTLLVAVVQSQGQGLGDAKLPFYVLFTLLGIVLAAQQRNYPIEWQLRVAALIAGLFGLVSVIHADMLTVHIGDRRVVAIGLWNTVIMAAHAVGALAVLGCLLSLRSKVGSRWPIYVLVGMGLLLFLFLGQTRGVWLALLATVVVCVLARPSRWGVIVIGLGILISLAIIGVMPEYVTARGFSYRPELWQQGLAIFAEHWVFGLGFNDYSVVAESLGIAFKHPHNIYIDIGIRWGVIGLGLFLALWGAVAWRAWRNRNSSLGFALLGLWTFSSVALLTDGIGLWFKPNADWLITWLPIALSLVLAAREFPRECIEKDGVNEYGESGRAA
ncbi:hypothetical protein SRABI70_01571 [Pseudomonas sp. Bi70]|uniref:O-antigen ligase family protein n=1 Tax=Pseudomonas sp. Bi70 TaxID=2821127 RepID=UPI001D2A7227|nr:O-antigen ligase family protein [Pseudomonas sp. Bi70]CAH0193711.1 hypothetical protein SRABI70_01571 [Pseudomonas sp. Bi70]